MIKTVLDPQFLQTAAWIWIAFGLLLIPLQIFIAAPYGRYAGPDRRWGPVISNRLGWFLMEIVSPGSLITGYIYAGGRITPVAIVLLFWLGHYLNRSLIFPAQIHTRGKKMPLTIMISAVFFNSVNGLLNGLFFGMFQSRYDVSFFLSWHFLTGVVLFAAGMGVNVAADQYLISLRGHGRSGYFIPMHPLFRWISCPNHLGEIMEWGGFALIAWSLPAFAFFVWTVANLMPRSLHHHHWYRTTFADYPQERKALIPFLL